MVEVSKLRQTIVGSIPKEWEIQPLVNLTILLTKQTGFDYSAYIKPVLENSRNSDNIPFIQNKDFKGFKINYDTDYYIPKDVAFKFPKILLNEKCLLISISGSIGNVAVFDNSQIAFIGGAVAVAKFRDKSILNWVMYYLFSSVGQNAIFNNVKSGSHQNLTLEDIRKLNIPLPSSEEQTAIATALSDMDALIAQTEKLIEKKKAIKQGVMQELLSPKEGWVTKKLGEVCAIIKSGGTPLTSNNEFYNGNIPFLSIGDMTSQGKYLNYTSISISNKGLANSASWIVPTNSIIYSMYASVGFVSINRIELAISQAVLGIKFNDDISLDFMYYMLSSMQKSVLKFVGEGTQKNLNAKTVKGFEITLPDINTQMEIAHILSDIDNNIFILESKLQKLKYQKQGMMQALLTGKIRLI